MTKRTIRGNDAAHLDHADSQLERRLLGPNECPVHNPEAARVRRSWRRCQATVRIQLRVVENRARVHTR